MSKPVKEMIKSQYRRRFRGMTSVAVCGFTGLDAIATNKIRGQLQDKDIRLQVVKNSLARSAFRDIGMEEAGQMLDGPCAVAYGGDSVVSVVRELLDMHKEHAALTVKAALLEGEVFGEDRIEELSKFPTREEAIGKVVGAVLGAGGNLAGALKGPGGKLGGILKAIEEKQEGGEEAAA
jgi:large subunit ribosomal protein L10